MRVLRSLNERNSVEGKNHEGQPRLKCIYDTIWAIVMS